MTYADTLSYLYARVPMFHNIGAGAYKEGLQTTLQLAEYLGHKHRHFKTIHVAGTNGKGSCSHTLAAILQASGLFRKVGLYTSPHLVDFRERFRINGSPMPQQFVVDFVSRHKAFFEPLHPSFFELTTAMCFDYFAQEGVDIAIIETGLGGRLDCTNIITPILSLITNISHDHTQFLGDSLAAIATEKAGIIKPSVPVVIGQSHSDTRPVFMVKAHESRSPLSFADERPEVLSSAYDEGLDRRVYETESFGQIAGDLLGEYQQANLNTVLAAVKALRQQGINLSDEAVRQGVGSVGRLTQLRGRWQTLQHAPHVICDTGHNAAGITAIVRQLSHIRNRYGRIHLVFGMVNDKDLSRVLPLLPTGATYYFTQAATQRAIAADTLRTAAAAHALQGTAYADVFSAYQAALSAADAEDLIFVGGSSYVVADLLSVLE